MANKPEVGAYTQLFAGLHPDVTTEVAKKEWSTYSSWCDCEYLLIIRTVGPPGKIACPRRDLFTDTELSRKFWEWNEEQIKSYL